MNRLQQELPPHPPLRKGGIREARLDFFSPPFEGGAGGVKASKRRMMAFQLFAGLFLACAVLIVAALGSAQEKTEPKAPSNDVPRGFRMYLVSDGRFDEEAKDPAKKAPLKKAKDIRNRVGNLHDPVTEFGLNTVIGVFARTIPKKEEGPAFVVLKSQQALARKYRSQRLGAFMAFLALTKDFAEDDARYDRMKEIEEGTKPAQATLVEIGLAEATLADMTTPPQVKDWGIGPDDNIVIVLYHRFHIVKRWTFKADAPPTEKDLQDLAAAVAAIMGK
jgi:hypothetical protein